MAAAFYFHDMKAWTLRRESVMMRHIGCGVRSKDYAVKGQAIGRIACYSEASMAHVQQACGKVAYCLRVDGRSVLESVRKVGSRPGCRRDRAALALGAGLQVVVAEDSETVEVKVLMESQKRGPCPWEVAVLSAKQAIFRVGVEELDGHEG